MCRNIRTLFNFDPPASEDEIQAAARQFVRKISGFTTPSSANQEAFDDAIKEVTQAATTMLGALVTSASPRNRETETAKAHLRAVRRFSIK